MVRKGKVSRENAERHQIDGMQLAEDIFKAQDRDGEIVNRKDEQRTETRLQRLFKKKDKPEVDLSEARRKNVEKMRKQA